MNLIEVGRYLINPFQIVYVEYIEKWEEKPFAVHFHHGLLLRLDHGDGIKLALALGHVGFGEKGQGQEYHMREE